MKIFDQSYLNIHQEHTPGKKKVSSLLFTTNYVEDKAKTLNKLLKTEMVGQHAKHVWQKINYTSMVKG